MDIINCVSLRGSRISRGNPDLTEGWGLQKRVIMVNNKTIRPKWPRKARGIK